MQIQDMARTKRNVFHFKRFSVQRFTSELTTVLLSDYLRTYLRTDGHIELKLRFL